LAARGLTFLSLVALSTQAAWAQMPEAPAGPKSYVPVYSIAGLFIGLGVWLIVRPTNRTDEVKGEFRTGPTPKGMKGDDFHKPH
jgi:hypothetical protein